MGVNTRKTTTPRLEPPVTAVSKPSSFPMLLALRDLAWQLAFAIIAPVLLGNYLDKTYGTGRVLTIIGLGVAVIAAVAIVRSVISRYVVDSKDGR